MLYFISISIIIDFCVTYISLTHLHILYKDLGVPRATLVDPVIHAVDLHFLSFLLRILHLPRLTLSRPHFVFSCTYNMFNLHTRYRLLKGARCRCCNRDVESNRVYLTDKLTIDYRALYDMTLLMQRPSRVFTLIQIFRLVTMYLRSNPIIASHYHPNNHRASGRRYRGIPVSLDGHVRPIDLYVRVPVQPPGH